MNRVIAALAHVREVNGEGADGMRIHGVNLSVGYEFDPEWFACGRSPLCAEVDKLVRSGVVVVVAAGNSGYGTLDVASVAPKKFGLAMTINDPGNAERAITVGSTHRDAPHTYGVSYFSSKGPTGDGRCKPDLDPCGAGLGGAGGGRPGVGAPDLSDERHFRPTGCDERAVRPTGCDERAVRPPTAGYAGPGSRAASARSLSARPGMCQANSSLSTNSTGRHTSAAASSPAFGSPAQRRAWNTTLSDASFSR